jgi:lipopolysaccharide export system protein LptA
MRARRRGAAAFLALGWGLLAAATAFADPIDFSADSVQSSLAKDKEKTVLSGNVKVKTGSISISADRVELFGKDFVYLQCTGSVKVVDTDRKIRLDAPSLYYDRTKKITRTQGPSVLQDDKNKLVLKAEWIESDGENEVTIAEIAVRIVKDKLACRAEYVVYRRKDNTLELTGSPSVYKDGDDYESTRMIVNTDTEDIALEGDVKGSVSNKGSPAAAKPADGAAPAGPAPASAPGAGQPSPPESAPPPGATPPAAVPSAPESPVTPAAPTGDSGAAKTGGAGT